MALFHVVRPAGGSGAPSVDLEADGLTIADSAALTFWDGDPRGPSYGPQTVTYAFAPSGWLTVVREPDPEPEPEPDLPAIDNALPEPEPEASAQPRQDDQTES